MVSRRERLGGSLRKTELFQQKTRPGSHPRLPETRSIPNQQLLLPVWATTSASPEMTSEPSAFTGTKPKATSLRSRPGPLLTSSFPLPPKADLPCAKWNSPSKSRKPQRPKQAAPQAGHWHGRWEMRAQPPLEGRQSAARAPASEQMLYPKEGEGRSRAGTARRTAQLAGQGRCSTRGPSRVVGTRLRASVQLGFTPAGLVGPGPAHGAAHPRLFCLPRGENPWTSHQTLGIFTPKLSACTLRLPANEGSAGA